MIRTELKPDSVMFVNHAYYYDHLKDEYIIKKDKEPSYRILYLLSQKCETDFFKNMPKTFTISTKNSTLYFNIEMLKDTSPVITDFIRDNPNENNYFINITDDENVLSKMEQLYQGQSIVFKESDIPLIQQFTQIFQIKNCPNYLKHKDLVTREIDSDGYYNDAYYSTNKDMIKMKVKIYQNWFVKFLRRDDYKAFKIKTNKKEYNCNIFAVYTSNVIRKNLEKNPKTSDFVYNFEDKNGEFQLICDFFNYKKIDLEKVNIETIKSIAEELEIGCILKFVADYKKHCEIFSEKYEKHKKVVDSIDQLFDLLHNIKNIGIEKVKNSIVQSKWSQKEEDVQELAAFILQVIKPSFSLQNEIAELIIQLDKESNDQNRLNILIPFVVKKLMALFWPRKFLIDHFTEENISNDDIDDENALHDETINLTNRCVYSFIRILYKKGVIPKSEIYERLKKYDLSFNTLNAFFLPELIEIDPKNRVVITSKKNKRHQHFSFNSIYKIPELRLLQYHYCFPKFAQKYLPDKIGLYEKMLDKLEPDDELTLSLRHDDIESFSKFNLDEISKVPYNIFDDFEEDLSLINYAALYGSFKCFSYLLKNNHKIDEETFYFAINGNNEEIIKIVDQQKPEKEDFDKCFDNQFKYENINGNQELDISFWFKFTTSQRHINSLYFCSSYKNASNDKYNDDNVQYELKAYDGDMHYVVNSVNINNIIASTIAFHRNDLFDSTFENIFVSNSKCGNDLNLVASLSALCGNAHSLMILIKNGFRVTRDFISNCAQNGFYSLSKLLLDYCENEKTMCSSSFCKSIVHYDNLFIFKLFCDTMTQNDLKITFLEAVDKNSTSIIKYIFDNIDKYDMVRYDYNYILQTLAYSLMTKTSELFDFLKEQYTKLTPEAINMDLFTILIKQACLASNLSVTKEITDLILAKNPEFNFTEIFFEASSKSKSLDICQYFIDKKVHIDFENNSYITKYGSIQFELFEKIVNGVDPNKRFLFYECIDNAIENKNVKTIEYIFQRKPPNGLELIEAVLTDDIEIVELVLKYNRQPLFINQKIREGTALCVAIRLHNIDIVKLLLSLPGIDPSIASSNNNAAISIAARNYDLEIVKEIIRFYKESYTDLSPFLASTKKLVRNYQHYEIPDVEWQIIKELAMVNFIDVCLYKDYDHSIQKPLIFNACFYNKIDVVESFLNIGVDTNVYDPATFTTPLMVSLEKNNLQIAKLLINYPKTNINMTNFNNESALTVAVKLNQTEIIELILNDKRFDPKESKLNYAFIYAKNQIAKDYLLSLNSLDVNQSFKKNYKYYDSLNKSNALQHCVETNNIEKLEMVINHPSFNIYKSQIKKVIFIAAKANNVIIFKKLLELINNDYNIYNSKNESLISYAALHKSGDIIDLIHDKNDQIFDAFVESYSTLLIPKVDDHFMFSNDYSHPNSLDFYDYIPIWYLNKEVMNKESIPKKVSTIEIMKKLYDYDTNHTIDFDKLHPNGKSFFTAIISDYPEINAVCDVLINYGADPNKPDKNGVYPLEHAMKINSLKMANSLVNSNKINYSNCNYLHIAAKIKDSAFLELLLKVNKIDVNSVDEKGNTSLIEACKCKCIDNINLLFKCDNLDYLHCNNDGKDALDVISISLQQSKIESIKQNKEKYHNLLISTIEE